MASLDMGSTASGKVRPGLNNGTGEATMSVSIWIATRFRFEERCEQ
jgi:hypothetical protein